MNKPIRTFALLALLFALVLTACAPQARAAAPVDVPEPKTAETALPSPSLPAIETAVPTAEAQPEEAEPDAPAANPVEVVGELPREDAQGQVTVVVTPADLGQPGETLVFEVAMDTHSVDLSMDLAQLAELATDQGQTVPPLAWDAPRGGHHVSGSLIFPAEVDGKPLLDGASSLTLVLRDVDAPERIFSWQLSAP